MISLSIIRKLAADSAERREKWLLRPLKERILDSVEMYINSPNTAKCPSCGRFDLERDDWGLNCLWKDCPQPHVITNQKFEECKLKLAAKHTGLSVKKLKNLVKYLEL